MRVPVDVDVGATMRVRRCPERLLDALILRTRIAHPGLVVAERARRQYRGDRWWSPVVQDGTDAVVPRGLVRLLQDQAARCGVELRFRSHVVGVRRPTIPLSAFAIEPRPYQCEAIEAMHHSVQGVVVLPCGGGKTVLGGLALASLGQSGVVIVHTTDLYDQWHSMLSRLAPDRTRERKVRGPLSDGELAVMMVQGPDHAALATAAAVIVDEAHHTPSDTFSAALSACSARWRWGLTATPDRADGWSCVLDAQFGPVIYRRTALELIADGYLLRPAVIPVRVEWEASPHAYEWIARCEGCGRPLVGDYDKMRSGGRKCRSKVATSDGTLRPCSAVLPPDPPLERAAMKWSTALSEWAGSKDALRTIRMVVEEGAALGRQILVLVPRKVTAVQVCRVLQGRGLAAEFAVSGMGGRDRVIDRFRSGDTQVLVATQLADEGLDVQTADMLVMASCGKAEGLTQQRAGRVCRPSGHAVPLVLDLVPDGIAHQWPARRKAYSRAYGREALAGDLPLEPGEAMRIAHSLHAGQI